MSGSGSSEVGSSANEKAGSEDVITHVNKGGKEEAEKKKKETLELMDFPKELLGVICHRAIGPRRREVSIEFLKCLIHTFPRQGLQDSDDEDSDGFMGDTEDGDIDRCAITKFMTPGFNAAHPRRTRGEFVKIMPITALLFTCKATKAIVDEYLPKLLYPYFPEEVIRYSPEHGIKIVNFWYPCIPRGLKEGILDQEFSNVFCNTACFDFNILKKLAIDGAAALPVGTENTARPAAKQEAYDEHCKLWGILLTDMFSGVAEFTFLFGGLHPSSAPATKMDEVRNFFTVQFDKLEIEKTKKGETWTRPNIKTIDES